VNEDTVVVVEADEYDRSFHRLFPYVAIVTSADADHLDIYGSHEAVIDSFKQFIDQINVGGTLIVHDSVKTILGSENPNRKTYTYGMSRGQFLAGNITPSGGFFEFDLHGFDKEEHVTLGVPGFHNVENSIAASVAAHACGVDMVAIKQALLSFRGVKRRFEFIVKTKQISYVDDYAHHPAEIEAFLKSLKALFANRKVTAVFQPHLYTRTRDFAEGFAESLSLADELILMDIYPAREKPIPGVTSDLIFDQATSPVKIKCGKDNLLDVLAGREIEVLATIGAGDIDTFVEPIKDLILKRYVEA